jgi:hypothetical protein
MNRTITPSLLSDFAATVQALLKTPPPPAAAEIVRAQSREVRKKRKSRWMSQLLRLLGCSVMIACLACNGGTPASPSIPTPVDDGKVFISGFIRDYQTNAPVPNATVTIEETTTTTNVVGTYAMRIPPFAGSESQVINVDGESLVSIAHFVAPSFRGDFLAHIPKNYVGRYGMVIDAQTRRPIAGAHFQLAGSSTDTDGTGWFRLDFGLREFSFPNNPVAGCVGFNTVFSVVTHPAYQTLMSVEGRGVCNVVHRYYELVPR